MSEQSDSVVLVVSEETGAISIAVDSKLYYDLSPIEVTRKLRELLDKGIHKRETEQNDGGLSGNAADNHGRRQRVRPRSMTKMNVPGFKE
jgi:hypothetical protein